MSTQTFREMPSLDQSTFDDLSEKFSALSSQIDVYTSDDYIANMTQDSCEEGKKIVDEKCRQTMATWCYKILDFCNASKETCSAAMSNLDRFLSTERGNFALYDRRWFQLAVMCSLQLAIKMHDSEKLEMEALLQLGRGCYTEDEVVSMEEEILYALSWRLCPPTPYVFLEILIELIPSSPLKHSIYNSARKQIHKSVPRYSFSTAKQSSVACAVLLNVIEETHGVPQYVKEAFINNVTILTGVKCSDFVIQTLRMKLLNVVVNKSISKKQASNSGANHQVVNNNIKNEPVSPLSVCKVIG